MSETRSREDRAVLSLRKKATANRREFVVRPPPKTLRSIAELEAAGLLPSGHTAELEAVAERYAVAIPPELAALIDPNDPGDPIARQFVPDPAELSLSPGERSDPIGDDAHAPVEGIVHRHPDRVLLKLVHVCPVYCRFCFRRAMVGPGGRPSLSREEFEAACAYIRGRPEVWEVILTGGDPLILSARKLQEAMRTLAAIDHVRIIRIHTRVPVAAPERITPDLVGALRVANAATYVALHANHPRELTAAARAACARLIDAGIPMLSQSVLLKGVNDDAETLATLMRAFVEARIKPYYLHHADLAPGTAHLRTTLAEGQALIRGLRARASGLCQPAYMLDIPGGAGKVPAGPSYVLPDSPDGAPSHTVKDLEGRPHRYPPGED
jgi:lysine 2,3-aminomutase